MTENELGSDNIRDTHWLGEVVDNNDPLKHGRCKVKVYGKFDTIPTEAIPWAAPSNTLAPGQHFVPRIGDIVAITFDNGNIYLPMYSYHINQNAELKKEVLDGAANAHDVISLIYDAMRNFRFYVSKEDGLILTTGDDNHKSPMIRFNDGKIYLNAESIFISSNWQDEKEPAVKGETLRKILDDFMAAFLAHKHPTSNGPSGPPLPAESTKISAVKGKLETIKQVKAGSSTASNNGGTGSAPSSGTAPSSTQGSAAASLNPIGSTGPTTPAPSVTANSTNLTAGAQGSQAPATNETPVTYSTEDEIILDPNGAPVPVSGITSMGEEIDNDDKSSGNDLSTSFYNGNASSKQLNAIINTVEATLAAGEKHGSCARFTYNHAKNYVSGLKGKSMTKGASSVAGGNANGSGYHAALSSLGYRKLVLGSNISKGELSNALKQDYDIGDIVVYWAANGDAEASCRKYGHTQIFTGAFHQRSNGHKWSTDNRNNYNTYFVYGGKSHSKWNLLLFKAPTA
jgi:Type VI secretion system/phage-baseplate injector OB domain